MSVQQGRRRRATAATAVLLACALAPPTAHAALQLQRTEELSPRLVELTFATDMLTAPTHVRVLLPAGYDPQGTRRYPVLYLLHGGDDDYRSWTRPADGKGDAEAITARYPLIVVMPDAGRGGWYTDWYNNGAGGPPKWESYHVGQLIPWVDAHLKTIADRRGRAIAGLSMGGFGALSYAARHPDLFVAASTWSGAVDTNQPGAGHVLDAIAGLDGGQPGSLWGLRETEEVRWRGHNPWDLAANLRGMTLAIHTGDGRTGGPYGGGGDPLEPAVHQMSVSFHERLAALDIDHVWDDYGPGGHAWPYWNRDLREDLPGMMDAFRALRSPRRASFSYTTIEPEYAIDGWSVRLERRVVEFSTLRDTGAGGFTLRGSGDAVVTTPARYRPGAAYTANDRTVVAGRDGRLRIPVALGPPNTTQEYRVPGSEAGSAFTTVAVRILRAGPCASRRRVTIALPARARRARRLTVLVNGRRRAVLRGPRRRVTVSLAGLGAGRARVVLRAGRATIVRRSYRLCAR